MNLNQNKINAALILESGEVFYGHGIGDKSTVFGELCFNTAMTGYQEILTDPSYSGQIINFTFPHIGNIGTNDEDIESKKVYATGLILRNDITSPSNFRANAHFEEWLKKNKVVGICGVDTRSIVHFLRNKGACNAAICHADSLEHINIEQIKEALSKVPSLKGADLAGKVTTTESYAWEEALWRDEVSRDAEFKVVAIDFGVKLNSPRSLVSRGCEVVILPATAKAEEILSHNPDGIFLSNGPGDPAATGVYFIPEIKKIMEKRIPIFGICLGHQILALAIGGTTTKMHQGHRGANHPVQNLRTRQVEITSQNHGFHVIAESLPSDAEVTHISLFDGTVEGLRLTSYPAFSVQYHPESSPGPHDSLYLFDDFITLMKENKK